MPNRCLRLAIFNIFARRRPTHLRIQIYHWHYRSHHYHPQLAPINNVSILHVKNELDNFFIHIQQPDEGVPALRQTVKLDGRGPGKYYDLGVESGKGSNKRPYIDASNLSHKRVSWNIGVWDRTKRRVGETHPRLTRMSDWEIKQAGTYPYDDVHCAVVDPNQEGTLTIVRLARHRRHGDFII